MAGTRIHVVIVNYRTADLALDCIRSIEASRRALPALRATIVDNDSRDGSDETLRTGLATSGFGDWVEVFASPVNGGFSAGNNLALRRALKSAEPPEFFVFLNPDTRAQDGALETLVSYLRAHPRVGIAGSGIEDADGAVQAAAFRFPGPMSEFVGAAQLGVVDRWLERFRPVIPSGMDTAAADWVSGAAFAARREALEAVDLFDEGYFLYYEDTDLCRAVNNAGWTCMHVPSSRIIHLHGRSTGAEVPGQRRPPHWFEARRRYLEKNLGRLSAGGADLAWVAGHLLGRVARLVRRQTTPPTQHLLRDFLAHSVLSPRNWRAAQGL